MPTYDIVLLTDARYVNPTDIDQYTQNVLTEDRMVAEALEAKGLKVWRTNWDNPTFNWSDTRYVLFRTTWDYFHRITEFFSWFNKASKQTTMINSSELIQWNIDKFYLQELHQKGIDIPPTRFIAKGDPRTLADWVNASGWQELILKPAISGGARHTYRFMADEVANHENTFRSLIADESMLLQQFQNQIMHKGEVAFMVFGGKYTHAILKKGKKGDFRVQDDFGGTVHPYVPSSREIAFAERVVAACSPQPLYARVDVMWNNQDNPCLSELELIEPELWFREHPPAAHVLADAVISTYFSS